MTLDRMPPRPPAGTLPRPPAAPEADRRAARVRPYCRHQVHHPTRLARPVGQAAPMRDRAVLARRPEAVVPAARVEPSPDAVRTQPLALVEVGV